MQLYFILYANPLHNKDGVSPRQLHIHNQLLHLSGGKGSGSLRQPPQE